MNSVQQLEKKQVAKQPRRERQSQAVLTYHRKHFFIPHCGCPLCGNTGIIETRHTHLLEKRKAYCICSRGQEMRITESAENYRPPARLPI
jgi:hypothetical protein